MYYKEIIDAIFYLKESIPSDVILMASGKIDPSKFALLSYIGIDLIDGTYLLYAGFSDLYYNGDGMKWLRQIKGIDDIPCSCESCLKLIQNISKNPSITDKFEGKIVNDLIAIHNLEFGLNEIKRIKSKIELGVLRSYLEKRCMESTFLMSSLRYIDSLVPNPIEEVQRLYKNSHLICSNTLSYQEPQIVRFRKRVEKKYYPNPDTKICVFLPCSMVKPYSKSKSHRKYIKAIKSGALEDFDKISQIIITSPLGLVPRELEGVYPAAHYDISVTGDWDHEETAITAKCIASFIRKLPEEIPIIAHLSQGYLKAFENARKIVENNHTYIITSDLEGLKYEIRNQLQKINIRSKQQLEDIRIKESLSPEENMIKIIADFQFGYGAGELLIGSAARFLQSRNEKFKEIYGYESFGKVNLGRYIRKSGQIKLSYLGGERLTAIHGNSITLNTTDIKGSSIFKPAVEKIDEKLCSGDDVIIFTPTRDYYGIGEMIVNAKTALKLRRGAVVKIRKKKKK